MARKLSVPILVTSKAYCCIDKENPFFLGKLGYGYSEKILEFLQEYSPNQVIAFGTSLGEKDISGSLKDFLSNREIDVCGNEPEAAIRNFPEAHLYKVCSLAQFVDELSNGNPERVLNPELIGGIKKTKKEIIEFWINEIEPSDLMAKSIHLLNNLNNKYIVHADSGNHLLDAGALLYPGNLGSLFLDVGIRSMGSGLCAAVGMAFALPSKKHVIITGDGCMLMNGNVMHLIREYNLPVSIIIFNNHSLGRVRVGQSLTGHYRATDIEHVDFQMYGKAFGIRTYQFDSLEEYKTNVYDILSDPQPSLIEVITDNDEIPVTIKHNIY